VIVAGPPDAPPIVFIHGIRLTGAMWTAQQAALADAFRTIAVDLPAHGVGASETFTLEGAVDSVAATIRKEGGGRAVVVGLSLGGYVAMTLAAREPGLVRGLMDHGMGGLQHNAITARLEELVNWARARSSWPANFGLACCAIEMMATGGAHYDLSRFGMEVFRASPRQADIMIVAGRVSQKMAPVLRQVYDQMMEPKWVISMGACASTGGMFNNYAIVQGVDQVVPVDVYAPGCPPTPETLLHAIETLHQLIEDGEIMRRREVTGAGADVHVTEVPSTGRSTPVLLGRG
jgi:NADH-quinone oxidoreductase subunit B